MSSQFLYRRREFIALLGGAAAGGARGRTAPTHRGPLNQF
jgi:hypothetical protein